MKPQSMRNLPGRIAIGLVVALLPACTQQALPDNERDYPTIVLLIADDLGLDVAPCHDPDSVMKHLAARCEASLVFDRAYAHPVCTPSRASLMTGRHPFRTGTGDVRQSARKLSLDEETLAERVRANSPGNYIMGAFGKWHLADDENGAEHNPGLQGFDIFEGTPRQHDTYRFYDYDWMRNGVSVGNQSTYRTTRIVDAVIENFISSPSSRPSLYWVSFTNPHKPYHIPPSALHSQGDLSGTMLREISKRQPGPDEYHANRREPRLDRQYNAMLEALDNEIERLVTRMDEVATRPIIYIFLGDNGSAAEVYRGPGSAGYRAKASLYEGGIRVPVQIWSSHDGNGAVETGRSDALVHLSDLFLTISELTGSRIAASEGSGRTLDSVSFAGILKDTDRPGKRDFAYVERGNLAMMPFAYGLVDAAGFKLILRDPVRPTGYAGDVLMEFYDTARDPGETSNLLVSTCSADLSRVGFMLEEITRLHASEPQKHTTFSPDPYRSHLAGLASRCASETQ
ncbi:MAG: sulfatase-like hydrolase/transferase [Alphaproteobacteria bacterium]|nr:sulfatase-like hydrolase/transferase [Alphaproteobacteria bacterium]